MANISELYSRQWRNLDDVKDLLLESKERVAELHEEIIGEVLAEPQLSQLTSTSKSAIWRLWAFVTACMLWFHEMFWMKYRLHLEEATRFAQPHTASWYWRRTLEYQHGDTVQVINGVVGYNPINTANQIITAAAVKEVGGQVIIKVAKTVSSALAPLSGPELTGFEAYLDEFKDAGVFTNVVSQNADVLKLVGTVYYNPAQQTLTAFQTALETAINGYVQNLPFDGTFRRLHMIDAMQAVSGFVDIDIDALQASVAYTTTPLFSNIDLTYDTVAGYMNIDANFELTDTLTYQAV